jgi:hypothetical protein
LFGELKGQLEELGSHERFRKRGISLVHHAREHKRNETRLQVPVFISSGDFIDRQLQQLTEALLFSRSTKVNRFGTRLVRRA